MRISIALVIGAALLAFALIANAPASLVDRELAAATIYRVRLADVRGLWWSGSGELLLLPAGARQPVAWTIELWPLLHGAFRGTLATGPAATRHGQFAWQEGRLELHQIELTLPANAVLQTLGAPAMLADATGMVNARLDSVVRRAGTLSVRAVFLWQGATLPGPGMDARIGLGEVHLDFSGQGPESTGALRNAAGDVDITGTVTVGYDGSLRLEATVRPSVGLDQDRRKAIAVALSAIGRSDGQGGWHLSWSAPLQ